MKIRKKQNGFVLVYTVLILSILVITAGIIANTTLKEVTITRDEAESLKAFYAADAGLECVRHFQSINRAFNTTSPQGTYNCGVGADFTAGYAVPTAECEAHTYNFTVSGFSNGACANITVEIIPREITVNGNPVIVCDADVISQGLNRCGAGTTKVVERVRWEKM